MTRTPWPVFAVAACVATSLFGDGSLYVVLPVVFQSRGLSPMECGLVLSANRWTRLLTNMPAAQRLGVSPVRTTFGFALLIGGLCSLVYGATSNIVLLVMARCAWGACWSVLRLAGLLVVTDCVEAGLATESMVGRMTGLFAGCSRLGGALSMTLSGLVCDRLGFDNLFYLCGVLTMLASPYAWRHAFGPLPAVSVTAARRLAQKRERRAQRREQQQQLGKPCICYSCALPRFSAAQLRLFALAFAASAAGNGMIVATLGAILAAHASVDPSSGRSALDLGGGVRVDTATFNGLLLGVRWAVEGLGAPLFGRLVDRCGWRVVAPCAFALSSANGALGFALFRAAEQAGAEASGTLLACTLLSVLAFFVLVSAADLCVKAMGVAWREAPLLVQGDDLGAAVGPLLGYALLQAPSLPPSAVLATQSLVHGVAAVIACAAARSHSARMLPSSCSSCSSTSRSISAAGDTRGRGGSGAELQCVSLTTADSAAEQAEAASEQAASDTR
jgi:hypothetical protein